MDEPAFEYTVASDVDFDNLIADIGFDDKLVALLTQEDGLENLRIRIYPPWDCDHWDFRFDEFEDILKQAKQRLWELRKIEDTETTGA